MVGARQQGDNEMKKIIIYTVLAFVSVWGYGFISAVLDGGSDPANLIKIAELRVRQELGSHNSISRHGYKTYVDLVSGQTDRFW